MDLNKTIASGQVAQGTYDDTWSVLHQLHVYANDGKYFFPIGILSFLHFGQVLFCV